MAAAPATPVPATPAKQGPKVRAWCFTENHEPEALVEALRDEGLPSGIRYLVCQLERAPNTRRLHLQGYVQLLAPQRLSWLKKNLSGTAHWARAYGSYDQNEAYCSKAETRVDGPWRFGEATTQGKRKELEEVKDLLDNGVKVAELPSQGHFSSWLRYKKGFDDYVSMTARRTAPQGVKVEVHYGAPGAGKSTALRMDDPGVYIKPPNSKWWDGYAGERIVVFNDFTGAWFKFHDLMAILDPYPLLVETKGGHVQLLATEFRISSNYPPLGWYSAKCGPFAAINRRLSKVVHYPYAWPYPLNGAPAVEKDVQPAVPVVRMASPATSPDPTPPASPDLQEEEPNDHEGTPSPPGSPDYWGAVSTLNEEEWLDHPPQEIASPRIHVSSDTEEEATASVAAVEVMSEDEEAETEPDTIDYEFDRPLKKRRRMRNPFILDEAECSDDDSEEEEASDLDSFLDDASERSDYEHEASDSLE